MEKRIVVTFVLTLAVLLGYQYVLLPYLRPPVEQPHQVPDKTLAGVPTPGKERPFAPAAPRVEDLLAQDLPEAGTFQVETDLYVATFSARGGGTITSWQLKKYLSRHDNRPVELVRTRGLPPLSLVILDGEGTRPLLKGESRVDRNQLRLNEQTPSGTVTFTYEEPGGVRIRRTLTFYNQGYRVDVAQQVRGLEAYQVALGSSFGIFNERETTYNSYIGLNARAGRVVVREDFEKFEGTRLVEAIDWVAIQDKYFMAALIPPQWVEDGTLTEIAGVRLRVPFSKDTVFTDRGRSMAPRELKPGDPVVVNLGPKGLAKTVRRGPGGNHGDVVGFVVALDLRSGFLGLRTPREAQVAFTVPAGHKGPLNFRLYAGPKALERLKAQGARLEDTIDYGYFTILAMPMFYVMQWLYGVTGNYGVAIIGLTVLLKIIFLYPTHLSYSSMKAMQAIQPKAQQIKEKYKKDPKRMQKETMELYKTHKVNPLGGCLPMLLQVPFFIGLYNLFSAAIELRRAPFVGWIQDLSLQDPYYILPVLMGASMFVSQKMTPTTGDSTQQRVMMFLPLVFTFFFLTFPAGLVLYWLVNNLLTIAQQAYIHRKK